MTKLRLLLAGITTVLLTAAYLASQQTYFAGTFAEYAAKVDQPQIAMLSLLLFLAAVVLCFVQGKQESEE